MSVRQRAVDRGAARGRAIVVDLCRELEAARLQAGLSFADLGRAVGISGQQAARICRGRSLEVSIVRLAGLIAAVGLDLSARVYPGGAPIRDAAHTELLNRLRAQLPGTIAWRVEVPVLSGVPELRGHTTSDRRAWDAVLIWQADRVGVEAETRLSDLQALERRIALKQRDGDMPVVLLLVNDTLHNRRVVGMEAAALRHWLAGSPRQALRRLRAGRPPTSSTLLML